MTTEIVDPQSLRLHPLLKEMPAPAAPELIESMEADIEERGIDLPIIVDEKNRVMDGRIRWQIAVRTAMPEIVVIRRSSDEVATTIVQSLLQRRHYSKSALAYLAYPFFEKMVEESRQRGLAVLRSGGKRSAQNALRGNTAEEIARRADVSRRLFFQAAEVHKLFGKHANAKTLLEPQILAGDLCLGYAINGVAGLVSTQGKPRGADDQLELFKRGIQSLRTRWTKWNQLEPKMQTFVANEFAAAITEAPAEIQDRILSAIRASRKGLEEKSR